MSTAVAFDPFEPGFDAWPYDQYRRLREAEPVHWSDVLSGWVLTRYEDVTRVREQFDRVFRRRFLFRPATRVVSSRVRY